MIYLFEVFKKKHLIYNYFKSNLPNFRVFYNKIGVIINYFKCVNINELWKSNTRVNQAWSMIALTNPWVH